ncbi:hypothetical protein ACQJBY_028427 [Aegilops geniculata]
MLWPGGISVCQHQSTSEWIVQGCITHIQSCQVGRFRALMQLQVLSIPARGSSTDTSKETKKECLIRESLEWSDGTRKVATSSKIAERKTENVHRLVKALLDKKHDDEGLEYELKDIVHWQSICEGPNAWYYHLNITMKTKGAGDDASTVNQFFAEVTLDQSDTPGYFLSSFCRIDPNSKGSVHSYLKLSIFGILFEIIC